MVDDTSSADDGPGNGDGIRSMSRDPDASDEIDDVFGLIGIARRRYLLYHLHARDDAVEFDEAVRAVRAYEGIRRSVRDPTQSDRIRIDLHHNQLPRLERAGVIDHDRRQGTIRYRGNPLLETWLERVRSQELG